MKYAVGDYVKKENILRVCRNSERNISYQVSIGGELFFVKKGVGKSCNPALEAPFCAAFGSVPGGYAMTHVASDIENKIIVYEWLNGYACIDYADCEVAPSLLKLIEFLETNAVLNGKNRLPENVMSISQDRRKRQASMYKENLKKLRTLFKTQPDMYGESVEEMFLNAITAERELTHGDLGRSNILRNGDGGIKIIDYEYAMLGIRETDYARLIATQIFELTENKTICIDAIRGFLKKVLDLGLDYESLSVSVGFLILMRLYCSHNSFVEKERLTGEAKRILRQRDFTSASVFKRF